MLHFAYGANMSRDHMHLWCPHAKPVSRAVLPDHRLVFRFWADILASPGQQVPGALYEVPEKDLTSLAEYEDAPNLYEETTVEVEGPDGPVRAMTYKMREGYDFAPPSEAYLELLRQGYEDWNFDLEELPVGA